MDKKFDYLVESERTLSGKFYGKEVKASHVRQLLISFSNSACLLDKVKKGVFYGKEIELLPKSIFHFGYAEDEKDIFHAIIGIATEAGELAEAYLKTFEENGEIDLVNLCEEIGDIFWYAAIIARQAGVSFEDIQRNNIEKLAKRFPDKFTEFNANNRDLAGEREILEKPFVQVYANQHQYSKPNDVVSVRGEQKQLNEFLPVELPNSIEAEVACISKAKLIEAFKASETRDDLPSFVTHEEIVDWIFKNFA